MNSESFEKRLLELWMTTRIPLTRANLAYCTKAPRRKMEKWLDAMVAEGVLDVDVDDEGEMAWAVKGAARSPRGPTTVAELDARSRLGADIAGAGTAMVLASRARDLVRPSSARGREMAAAGGEGGGEQKSVAVAALASFALGPLGWLYAAPWKTAVPYAIGYALVLKILPSMLLLPLLGVILPVSALMGAAYAWRYNQKGERTPILGREKAEEEE